MKIIPNLNTVENLFDESSLALIQNRIMDPMMTWGTYPPTRADDIRLYDWYQFSHLVYDCDMELSERADICKMILAQALDKTGRRLDRLFRIKIVNSLPGELGRSQPSIDIVGPHQTGFFFPETSDGDTEIMQERSWLDSWDTPQEFTTAHKLAPIENTWYDLDGTHWRFTGRPKDYDQRICVIFNFVASPK